MKYDYIIGIDPGVKTGIAFWNKERNAFDNVMTTDILHAIEMVGVIIDLGCSVFVRIEDPNKRKWYGKNSNEKQQGAGSIKRDFSIWQHFLKKNNIPYDAYAPKSVITKIDSKSFQKITGWKERTSNHSRDAAMAVYGL